MEAGNLTRTGDLSDTRLYFNVVDCDGNGDHSYGPTWAAKNNDSCYFDDPGLYALGANAGRASIEMNYNHSSTFGVTGLGFGFATRINTGTAGTGANHMKIYVR